MRKHVTAGLLVGLSALFAAQAAADDRKANDDQNRKIQIRDDCDPTDPAWAPTGGCTLKGGAVNFAEFGLLLFSPLSAGSPIGHPAWRMDPTYVRIDPNDTLRVTNTGGRHHTFTEVAQFGGGFVGGLNGTLLVAPECPPAASAQLAPGDTVNIHSLSVGDHRFQCCIHPWMRMLVKVEAEEHGEGEHEH